MKKLRSKFDWFSGMHLIFWLMVILPNSIPFDTSSLWLLIDAMGTIFMIWFFAFFMYLIAIMVQLVIHIINRQERTLLPLWLMFAIVLTLIGSLYGMLDNKPWLALFTFVMSWVFYLLYLKCNHPQFLENYRSNARYRYSLWALMIIGIIISFI